MRKQYKSKRRACGLCKPHKRGLAKRWKARDALRMQAAMKHLPELVKKLRTMEKKLAKYEEK